MKSTPPDPVAEKISSKTTFKLPSKETTFSFDTAINLYNAYSFGGAAYAGVVAVTSLADKTLLANDITSKNYLSLSSFWGYVGWKAVKQIQSTDTIPAQYKIPLYASVSLIGLGMIGLGSDIFAQKTNDKNIVDSVKLMSGFFDKTDAIPQLEEQFSKGYIRGLIHTVQHTKQLLSNKFISHSIMYQAIDIAKIVLIQKFFQYMPTGKMASFFAAKETKPFEYLVKLSSLRLAKEIIEIAHSKMAVKLTESVKKDIDKHVIELALQNDNTQKVMNLGDKVNNLSNEVSTIFSTTTSQTSQAVQSIVMPLVMQSSLNTQTSTTILDSNSSLFLLDSLIKTIFSDTNIYALVKWLEVKFFGSKKENDSEDTDFNVQKFGTCSLRIQVTPSDYAYGNIQEITKLGGNEFMLSKVLAYIEKNPAQFGIENKSTINYLLGFIKNTIEEFIYAGIFISQGTTQEQLFSIETDINNLTRTLGLNNNFTNIGQEINPKEIQSTLNVLKGSLQGGPERSSNNKMALSLKDYHLKKASEPTNMLDIKELIFESGHIYAITGPIGTGKTTLLTDIAKCLWPVFSSSGKILYPILNDGKPTEKIFCGTIPFSPPATTLLERLTYRLDQEYVTSHNEELIQLASALFTACGQVGFSKEKLVSKGNDDKLHLSTGQIKLAMIISAIIYKEHTKKPVLFVMDETLANLDIDTTNSICAIIKKSFADSIILSVDHNAKHNEEFYTDFVDLAGFRPEAHEVEVIGGEPTDLKTDF